MAQQNEFTDFEIGLELDGVQEWGGEKRPLCPAGDYQLKVAHIEQKPSSNQQPMIVVTFEVADGENIGTKVWNNYSLQPQALGRLKQLMIACGANLSKFVASELLGATILGSVVHVDGQPKTDGDGNVKPAGVFANVVNEQPLQQQAAATPAPPPITNKGTQKPAGNSAQPRRT